MFRGVLSGWGFQPSLERLCDDWDVRLPDRPAIEKRLMRDFKRAYPSRAEIPAPRHRDDLAWLSLMQHYGAPTRLLDWTFSPFIAAFFALDHLLDSKDAEAAVVWELSGATTSNKTVRAFIPEPLRIAFDDYSAGRCDSAFRRVFLEAEEPVAFVSPVNPYTLSERLVIQQGTFLCPGDVTVPFESNLYAMPGIEGSMRRIVLSRGVLHTAFEGLYKMNITYATLFPGLDGYAKNLRHRIGFLYENAGAFHDKKKY